MVVGTEEATVLDTCRTTLAVGHEVRGFQYLLDSGTAVIALGLVVPEEELPEPSLVLSDRLHRGPVLSGDFIYGIYLFRTPHVREIQSVKVALPRFIDSVGD